jgi:hypothetical protein
MAIIQQPKLISILKGVIQLYFRKEMQMWVLSYTTGYLQEKQWTILEVLKKELKCLILNNFFKQSMSFCSYIGLIIGDLY